MKTTAVEPKVTWGKFRWRRYHVVMAVVLAAIFLSVLDTLCFIWAGRESSMGPIHLYCDSQADLYFDHYDNSEGRAVHIHILHVSIGITY
jgi:hypothetical protein